MPEPPLSRSGIQSLLDFQNHENRCSPYLVNSVVTIRCASEVKPKVAA